MISSIGWTKQASLIKFTFFNISNHTSTPYMCMHVYEYVRIKWSPTDYDTKDQRYGVWLFLYCYPGQDIIWDAMMFMWRLVITFSLPLLRHMSQAVSSKTALLAVWNIPTLIWQYLYSHWLSRYWKSLSVESIMWHNVGLDTNTKPVVI